MFSKIFSQNIHAQLLKYYNQFYNSYIAYNTLNNINTVKSNFSKFKNQISNFDEKIILETKDITVKLLRLDGLDLQNRTPNKNYNNIQIRYNLKSDNFCYTMLTITQNKINKKINFSLKENSIGISLSGIITYFTNINISPQETKTIKKQFNKCLQKSLKLLCNKIISVKKFEKKHDFYLKQLGISTFTIAKIKYALKHLGLRPFITKITVKPEKYCNNTRIYGEYNPETGEILFYGKPSINTFIHEIIHSCGISDEQKCQEITEKVKEMIEDFWF